MKRIEVLSTALIVLSVAGSTAVQAQGNRGRTTDQRAQQAQGDPRTQRTQTESRDPRNERAQNERAQNERAQEARAPEQQRSVDERRALDNESRQRLEQQARIERQRADELQEARRAADYRAQQEYAERMQQEQQRLRNERNDRNYAIEANVDPRRNYNYRYNVGGIYRETNQYGVDVLRQAVNNGYLEGVRAGQMDRQDRWPPNFQNSRAYRDAGDAFIGVNSTYIDGSDYTYYFRQGFQRGYEDGYYSRSQYGNYSNGAGSVLGDIVLGILGLESIR